MGETSIENNMVLREEQYSLKSTSCYTSSSPQTSQLFPRRGLSTLQEDFVTLFGDIY